MILSILLLVGCGNKNPRETESADGESNDIVETLPLEDPGSYPPGSETTVGKSDELVQTLPLEDLEFYAPTEDASETTENHNKAILAVVEVARYGGPYVEDGSDEAVENVACVLVENTTEQYVDYGVITATVGGRDCSFTVTGLPGGRAVWVMESRRTPVEGDGAYSYLGETLSPLRDVSTEDERVTVELQEGKVVLTNVSEKDLSSVRLYYKQLHTDGNFLGGITYAVHVDGLKAGESKVLPAGHCYPGKCTVVLLDITE